MVTSPNPLTRALLSVDWWTDELAEREAALAADPHDHALQQRVDEARLMFDRSYARARHLFELQDERDARDEWMSFVA